MPRFLAIDFDSSGVFIASANTGGGGIAFDSAAALTDGIPALTVQNAAELGLKIKALMQEAKIPPAPVLACLPRDRIVVKDVKYPPGPVEQEPALVRFQSQKDLTDSPDDLLMDYAPAPAQPGEATRKATVAFVRKEAANAVKAVCDAAGLKLQAILPRPYAAAAGLRYALAKGAIPSPEEANPVLAQLSVGSKGGEFSVAQGAQLLFSRTISGMSLASENAFVGEVKRSLAAFSAQHPNATIRAISYCEGDVPGGGWAGRLQSVLPVAVYPSDPLSEAGPLEHVPARLRGRFFGAVGMLAAKAENAPFGMNFLAPRAPKAEPNKYRSRVLIGALLLMLVLGVGFVFGRMAIDRSSKQVAELTAMKSNLDDDIQALELNSKRLAAADEFANREIAWIDIFYDLNDQFPNIDKMRLQEIDGSITVQTAPAKGIGTPSPSPTPSPGSALKPPGGSVPLKPATPEKEKKGQLRVLLVAEEAAMPEKLKDTLNKESGLGNVRLTTGGLVGSANSKVQQFTINADVFKRKPEEFSRRIPPPPPPPKVPEPEKPAEVPGEDPLAVPEGGDVPLPEGTAPVKGGAQ
jgi:hypothetical protein